MIVITLEKFASEFEKYNFRFSNRAEILAGDNITSVTSITASPSGLTLGSPVISGSTVQVPVGSGTAGVTYDIACVVVTSSGATLEVVGRLFIEPE